MTATRVDLLPPIDGRADFARALRLAVDRAAHEKVRELCLVDIDFADWPLGEPAMLDALSRWAGPKRQFLLVARRFDALARQQPRFVAWRRTWAHLITCRAAPELDAGEWPSLLIGSPGASVQRLDRLRSRGRWLVDEDDVRAWREVVDAVLQRSDDAFPAYTLGL